MQGMGEGEGKKDVSDQIEDEDQLLGAQQKDQPPPDSKVTSYTSRAFSAAPIYRHSKHTALSPFFGSGRI